MITEIICDNCHEPIHNHKDNYIKITAQIIHSDLTLEYCAPSLDLCKTCAKKLFGVDVDCTTTKTFGVRRDNN